MEDYLNLFGISIHPFSPYETPLNTQIQTHQYAWNLLGERKLLVWLDESVLGFGFHDWS